MTKAGYEIQQVLNYSVLRKPQIDEARHTRAFGLGSRRDTHWQCPSHKYRSNITEIIISQYNGEHELTQTPSNII